MQGLVEKFKRDDEFEAIVDSYKRGLREQLASGLSNSARQIFYAALYQTMTRPLVIVTHNMFQAQKIYDDMNQLLPSDEVWLYPANEMVLSEVSISSPETLSQRIEVLNALAAGKRGVLVVPYAGVRRTVIPVDEWKRAQYPLAIGEEIELENFLGKMIALGYERVEMVETRGEISVRGGIIDIFPVYMSHPVRIELFDTEVDSIRTFDISNQRSIENLQEILIGPTREVFGGQEIFIQAAEKIEQHMKATLPKVKATQVKELIAEKVGWEIEQLRQGHSFTGIYKYISFLYSSQQTLIDYLKEKPLVLIDEPSRIVEAAAQLEKDEAEWKTALVQEGEFLPDIELSHSLENIIAPKKWPILHTSLFLRQVPKTNPQNIVNFNCKAMQNFHGQMNVLKTEMERWKKSNAVVVFCAADEERARRMERVFHDYEIEVDIVLSPDKALASSRPVITIGNLQSGFEMPMQHLVVVTESEVFTQKQRKASKTRKNISNAERIKSYTELQVGDYVVHVNHGIGKYLGIDTLEINGIHKDYLHVKYAGNDKLYVPIEQIDQVQKYVGSEEKEPKVYKLGGTDWKKVKSKVRASVQDIAQDLIRLYAERQQAKGYAFTKDGEEMREFEAMFPYDETEDQLRAIREIKEDMEKERPMDRLLCGDVGYGKTEVAIRAAFKAVMDGKQVALLVPTTILAQQHYETFRERFADYPVNISVISRFRTRKEQTQTIKGLKDGTVDVVIGTHRLLSKDIVFKDLGLLIVDEEQRFGVTHKEKLKRLKTNVDVLTLTATPIPRTLHMSMLGVRDLSVIETPPENRFPVQTYVMEYSAGLIREAIERELAREGQVYFLYNQVQGIDQMADQIRMLVPDARVAVAHGQMNETELESVMLSFLEGEADVLVSTTIIETGVDIPNVNTLIVTNADRMGLSQLYQLRGRVGRSNRIAYAYFTYRRDKVLTEVAEKRLQAIKEFTELGSGFKIAMRDLSIRGAGNLLGAEQHGFIASVGFDLYSQMLKDAIEELKGEPQKEEEVHPEINLTIDAFIPSDYIQDGKQKIEMYKKFAAVSSFEEIEDLTEELMDRFGNIPQSVSSLLFVSRLRVYAIRHRIVEIAQKADTIQLIFHEDQSAKVDWGDLYEIKGPLLRRITPSRQGQQVVVGIKVKGLKPEESIELVESFLTQFDELKKKKEGEETTDVAN
ncbi:transcription-repair coupling factor [Aneurinibacillus migulanus]|uniref:Transcription-repair-coupling factor n=1 Tax=Aneurinibacillus migulanus TaxID=47500 RepID=A0A0D1WMJ8_ANEMI|nr:transcription-repair coupling factor [Aneurinibacillus migulanus]KIV59880.1 transcription-repair coupling factor [Aneurinibacillus migulanus]KON83448.1 transcription-repair coupling factor [Aneurinibacillus migulanus]KPD06929.1 transcription-repair coupling factor [Aneurinibacillus migulanus]SDK05871.1 transcription-repair coupling factor [Aneurinibacillus migulanus]